MGKYNTNVYKDDKDRKHFLIPSTFSVLNSLGYCCCFQVVFMCFYVLKRNIIKMKIVEAERKMAFG
jgi:hypothetical protein